MPSAFTADREGQIRPRLRTSSVEDVKNNKGTATPSILDEGSDSWCGDFEALFGYYTTTVVVVIASL